MRVMYKKSKRRQQLNNILGMPKFIDLSAYVILFYTIHIFNKNIIDKWLKFDIFEGNWSVMLDKNQKVED